MTKSTGKSLQTKSLQTKTVRKNAVRKTKEKAEPSSTEFMLEVQRLRLEVRRRFQIEEERIEREQERLSDECNRLQEARELLAAEKELQLGETTELQKVLLLHKLFDKVVEVLQTPERSSQQADKKTDEARRLMIRSAANAYQQMAYLLGR